MLIFEMNFSSFFFVALLLSPTTISADEKDDRYVNIYQNKPLTSGRWDFVRRIALAGNTYGLLMIAHATHEKAYPETAGTFAVSSAMFGTAILVFELYEPVHVDLIRYTVGDEEFFIAKGEKDFNSVYYLIKIDEEGTTFRLGRHLAEVLPAMPQDAHMMVSSPEDLIMQMEDLPDSPLSEREEVSSLSSIAEDETESRIDATEPIVFGVPVGLGMFQGVRNARVRVQKERAGTPQAMGDVNNEVRTIEPNEEKLVLQSEEAFVEKNKIPEVASLVAAETKQKKVAPPMVGNIGMEILRLRNSAETDELSALAMTNWLKSVAELQTRNDDDERRQMGEEDATTPVIPDEEKTDEKEISEIFKNE